MKRKRFILLFVEILAIMMLLHILNPVYATSSSTDTVGTTSVTLSNNVDGIKVAWTNADNATGYIISRTKDGESQASEVARTTSELTWTDANVSSGTKYTYTVQPYCSKNGSIIYGPVAESVYYRLEQPVVKTTNPENGLTVSWNQITGATAYRIYRKADTETIWSIVKDISNGTTTSWSDVNVSSGKKYVYTVRAILNDSGKNYISSYASGPVIYRLDQPTFSLSGANLGIKITWNKIAGADSYRIYRKTNEDDKWTRVKTITDGSTLTWTDTSASIVGQRYYYTVRACKNVSGTDYLGPYHKGKSYVPTKIVTAESSLPATSENGVSVKINTASGVKTFKVYKQGASNSSYIRNHGCAICSCTTILSGYTSTYSDSSPYTIHHTIEKEVMGSNWSDEDPITLYGISKVLKAAGINSTYVQTFEDYTTLASDLKKILESGHPVLIFCNKTNQVTGNTTQKWASSLHTMAILGITDTGKAIVADSSNRDWSGSWQRIKLANLSDITQYMMSNTNLNKYNYFHSKSSSGAYLVINN